MVGFVLCDSGANGLMRQLNDHCRKLSRLDTEMARTTNRDPSKARCNGRGLMVTPVLIAPFALIAFDEFRQERPA